ncbi:MAG: fluoride efflux transporter FluC [Slackia sp.]
MRSGLPLRRLRPRRFSEDFLSLRSLRCVWMLRHWVLSALFEGPFAGRDHVRLFAVTGVLGGFTTFSTFSLETVQLLESGAWGMAGANAAVSAGACLAGVMAGRAIAHACLGARG